MVGILIVGHGAFGEALIHCCSHVLGKRPSQVTQLDVAVNDDPDAVLPRARQLLAQVDSGDGVLVLTDVLGATPSNIATRLLIGGRVEGVAGVSLPMLIRALTYRDEPLATVVEKAISGGCDGVVRIDGDAAGGS
jgi:PTS system ascorbate-specific IIA component